MGIICFNRHSPTLVSVMILIKMEKIRVMNRQLEVINPLQIKNIKNHRSGNRRVQGLINRMEIKVELVINFLINLVPQISLQTITYQHNHNLGANHRFCSKMWSIQKVGSKVAIYPFIAKIRYLIAHLLADLNHLDWTLKQWIMIQEKIQDLRLIIMSIAQLARSQQMRNSNPPLIAHSKISNSNQISRHQKMLKLIRSKRRRSLHLI